MKKRNMDINETDPGLWVNKFEVTRQGNEYQCIVELRLVIKEQFERKYAKIGKVFLVSQSGRTHDEAIGRAMNNALDLWRKLLTDPRNLNSGDGETSGSSRFLGIVATDLNPYD